MQQYNYEKNYPCGIIMIAMNTKNWNRNVEIFILVIHPRKPEQKEEKKLKLSASLCTILNILLKLTSSQIDVAQTRMKWLWISLSLRLSLSIRRFLLMDWNGTSHGEQDSKNPLFFLEQAMKRIAQKFLW